jgi:adenylate kinase
VLLGAPGAGKGTQANVLARHLALPRVATGDLFRAAARDGTPLGIAAKAFMDRGELVPDEVTVGMLLERLAAPDAARGVILDGFPRTRSQAEALDRALVERVAGGLAEPAPRVPGVCDTCGSRLIQREDDRPAVVQARLDKQLGALGDVVDHYRSAGLLQTVDGRRPIAAVTNDLLDCIEPMPYWRTHA